MNEITLTLNSPITEEQWDMIEDVDFDHTSEITFHTKHGKVVKFVKSSAQSEPHYDEWCTDCKEYDHERHCCPRFNRVIRETLDEAQAGRNTGKWIIDGHHIRCDQCGMAMCDTDREGDRIPRGFCPNCGARMDGEKR